MQKHRADQGDIGVYLGLERQGCPEAACPGFPPLSSRHSSRRCVRSQDLQGTATKTSVMGSEGSHADQGRVRWHELSNGI